MDEGWRVERGAGASDEGDASARARASELGAMLGRAFAENPVARACLDRATPEARLRKVTRLNLGLVRAAQRRGVIEVVHEAEGALAGAQLAFGPAGWPLDLRSWLAMAWGAIGTGLRGVERYARYDEHVHPLHPRAPHWYLWVLGVEPRLQGRGVGTALLRSFCARADGDGLPAYLETDRESSVRLYERHGFEVAREISIGELGGLRTWTMWREPR